MTHQLIDLAIKAFMGKLDFSDPETRTRRIAICNDCKFLSKLRMCKICGCFVDLKTRVFHASCPKGYWNSGSQKTFLQCTQLNSYWYFFDNEKKFGEFSDDCECEKALDFYKKKLAEE